MKKIEEPTVEVIMLRRIETVSTSPSGDVGVYWTKTKSESASSDRWGYDDNETE